MSDFTKEEISAVYRMMRERRDMRHFLPDPVDTDILKRIIEAAHLSPNVGMMQPWRFLRITDSLLRDSIHALVDKELLITAAALPSRNEEFLKVKIEGIKECAELLVVSLMPDRDKHIIGRRTMADMDMASIGCAIQNMWLAARAEGIGMGWVSFFEPQSLVELLSLPEGARPVAILCIGHVARFYPRPMFEETGWGKRLSMDDILFENKWPKDIGGTPTEY